MNIYIFLYRQQSIDIVGDGFLIKKNLEGRTVLSSHTLTFRSCHSLPFRNNLTLKSGLFNFSKNLEATSKF
jgi:hypothetical protein